jgi:hypothetical protein
MLQKQKQVASIGVLPSQFLVNIAMTDMTTIPNHAGRSRETMSAQLIAAVIIRRDIGNDAGMLPTVIEAATMTIIDAGSDTAVIMKTGAAGVMMKIDTITGGIDNNDSDKSVIWMGQARQSRIFDCQMGPHHLVDMVDHLDFGHRHILDNRESLC